MVQCENPICVFGWCHYNCVKVLIPKTNPQHRRHNSIHHNAGAKKAEEETLVLPKMQRRI